MVAFVIFWSATFAIIFFILAICFKALASAFIVLLLSLKEMLPIGALAAGVGGVLYLLYVIIDKIIIEGFWPLAGDIVIIIIVIGIIGAIIGEFGTCILVIVMKVVEYAFIIALSVLEWAADLCERKYTKFLKAIIIRLDKC